MLPADCSASNHALSILHPNNTNHKHPCTRSWCITYNYYSREGIWKTWPEQDIWKENVLYYVLGKEHHEKNPITHEYIRTPHIQGYVYLKTKRRMGFITELFNSNTIHCEPARSTPEKASEYCKKENHFIEAGNLPNTDPKMQWTEYIELYKTFTPKNLNQDVKWGKFFATHLHTYDAIRAYTLEFPKVREGHTHVCV